MGFPPCNLFLMPVTVGTNDRTFRGRLDEITKDADEVELKNQIEEVTRLAIEHPHSIKLIEENIPSSPVFTCCGFSFGLVGSTLTLQFPDILAATSCSLSLSCYCKRSALSKPKREITYSTLDSSLNMLGKYARAWLSPNGERDIYGSMVCMRSRRDMATLFGSSAKFLERMRLQRSVSSTHMVTS